MTDTTQLTFAGDSTSKVPAHSQGCDGTQAWNPLPSTCPTWVLNLHTFLWHLIPCWTRVHPAFHFPWGPVAQTCPVRYQELHPALLPSFEELLGTPSCGVQGHNAAADSNGCVLLINWRICHQNTWRDLEANLTFCWWVVQPAYLI